ncbi:MAG: hypothetical protein HQM01_13490 [Magnetococcales bacterium]|nr:hypothetical protein [Magnetococcales bacterium]
MPLVRILLLLVAGYALYRLTRHLLTPASPKPKPATRREPPPGRHAQLVRCARCDTLIPPEAAIMRDETVYCSEKCHNA